MTMSGTLKTSCGQSQMSSAWRSSSNNRGFVSFAGAVLSFAIGQQLVGLF